MTEKRFTLHKGLDTLNIMDNTKFNEHLYINKSSKDMKLLVGVLNALHEENQALKKQLQSEHQMLENAILLERTRMGQNALKQYKEAIQ